MLRVKRNPFGTVSFLKKAILMKCRHVSEMLIELVELQREAICYETDVLVRRLLQVAYVYKKRSSAELQWEAIFAMPRIALCVQCSHLRLMATLHTSYGKQTHGWRHCIQFAIKSNAIQCWMETFHTIHNSTIDGWRHFIC